MIAEQLIFKHKYQKITQYLHSPELAGRPPRGASELPKRLLLFYILKKQQIKNKFSKTQ